MGFQIAEVKFVARFKQPGSLFTIVDPEKDSTQFGDSHLGSVVFLYSARKLMGKLLNLHEPILFKVEAIGIEAPGVRPSKYVTAEI